MHRVEKDIDIFYEKEKFYEREGDILDKRNLSFATNWQEMINDGETRSIKAMQKFTDNLSTK